MGKESHRASRFISTIYDTINYTYIAWAVVECRENLASSDLSDRNVASCMSKVEFWAIRRNTEVGLQSPEKDIFTPDLCYITNPYDCLQW